MPPKKKSPSKDAEVSDRDLLQKAQSEILSLRRVLEQKNYEAVEARALEHSWRQRAEAAEAALDQAKADMADIKADMARQHASLQEHSSLQLSALEAGMAELHNQLAAAQQTSEQATAQYKQLLKEKEEQAATHQHDMEQLHHQFATLLQDTLSTMRSRLEEEFGAACGAS